MARIECAHESDVLMMVATGRWPGRAPAELREHAETCQVCRELGAAASAIDEMASEPLPAPLPGAGTVWWRAQLRARQDAARAVTRPMTVAQALAFAAMVGVLGAIFGATVPWFQRGLGTIGRLASEGFRAMTPVLPQDLSSVPTLYWVILLVGGIGVVAGAAVVGWAMKEE